jgi:hypothetical protein
MADRPDIFQGEPRYVPDFWGRAQNGLAEEVDETVFRFTITQGDAKRYPELKPGERLLLAKSIDGFVVHRLLPPRRTN